MDLFAAGMTEALHQAQAGLAEGGLPVGAALLDRNGTVLGRGRNRVAQDGDPLSHAEVMAFRDAEPRHRYRDCVMVTTAEPCWLCSGLIRQFGIGTVVIGASSARWGGAWLETSGIEVVYLVVPEAHEHLRRIERIERERGTWAEAEPTTSTNERTEKQ